PEHPDTLDSLDTYATSLMWIGQLGEAIERFRECLEARRRVLGPEHPDTLISMNNLAHALLLRGEWAKATPLLRDLLTASNTRAASRIWPFRSSWKGSSMRQAGCCGRRSTGPPAGSAGTTTGSIGSGVRRCVSGSTRAGWRRPYPRGARSWGFGGISTPRDTG